MGYENGSEEKQNQPGENSGRCLREQSGQNDFPNARCSPHRAVGDEADGGATKTEIEHAGSIGNRPRQRQQPEPRRTQSANGNGNEEDRRQRRNSERGKVENAVARDAPRDRPHIGH